MKIHHEKISTIAEMNVNAIRLYLQGDGRSATNTLIQAMRMCLLPQYATIG
jgi:hypothetical protein